MATPQEQEAAMIARLSEQTGRALDEWLKLVRSSGLTAHGTIVAHLKSEHGVTLKTWSILPSILHTMRSAHVRKAETTNGLPNCSPPPSPL
jgi:hypothetical protein